MVVMHRVVVVQNTTYGSRAGLCFSNSMGSIFEFTKQGYAPHLA